MPEFLITTEKYFFWFVLYSMVGWVYESIVESIRHKKPVNRGFLFGPYIPIYGIGALLDVLLLGWIPNPILLFFAAAVLTCIIEFIISVVLEKIFHRRWWDYNDFKFVFFGKTFNVGRFNIKGRVCLAGFLAFGTLSIVLVYLIHPLLSNLTDGIPINVFHIIVGIMLVLIITDIICSVIRIVRKKDLPSSVSTPVPSKKSSDNQELPSDEA